MLVVDEADRLKTAGLEQELEALEDLKLELRRDLDTKVTKYDLTGAPSTYSYISRKMSKRLTAISRPQP